MNLFDYQMLFPEYESELEQPKFEDFYNEIDENDLDTDKELKKYDRYYGQNVIWLGEEGRMIKCYPQYTSPLTCNVFDSDKMVAIRNRIQDYSKGPVVFTCCVLASPSLIDLGDVLETQLAQRDGRLHEMAIDRAFTTGDDYLDKYLVDKYEDELDDYELEELDENEVALKEAEENSDGDLGKYWITIRDGNHRTFGAFAAGEPFVWAIVLKNDLDVVESDDLR